MEEKAVDQPEAVDDSNVDAQNDATKKTSKKKAQKKSNKSKTNDKTAKSPERQTKDVHKRRSTIDESAHLGSGNQSPAMIKPSKWIIVRQWLHDGKLKEAYFKNILLQNEAEAKKHTKADKKGKKKDKKSSKKESEVVAVEKKLEVIDEQPPKPKCMPDFQSIEEQISFERVVKILKARRALQAAQLPPPPKAKPAKRLSKKQKRQLKDEEWQQLLKDVVVFRSVLLEEERVQRIAERASLEAKEDVMIVCNETRNVQLRKIQQTIDSIDGTERESEAASQADYKWEQYKKCDGIFPNLTTCYELNTYLHMWHNSLGSETADDAFKRTEIVMTIVEQLRNLIDNPLSVEPGLKEERIRILKELNDTQMLSLETATYYLLRNIRERMVLEHVRIGRHSVKTKYFTMCIWTKVLMPKPLPDPKIVKLYLTTIEFDEANVTVDFPASIDFPNFAVRLIWLKYNYLSLKCHTFEDPKLPPELCISLEEYTKTNFVKRQIIKYERKDIFLGEQSKSQAPKEPENRDETDENGEKDEAAIREDALLHKISYDREPQPLPSVMVIADEDAEFDQIKRSFAPKLLDNEINLRKFWIVGGMIHVTLLKQPPQPFKVYRNATATIIQLPAKMIPIPFRYVYVDPIKRLEDVFLKNRQKKLNEIPVPNVIDEETLRKRTSSAQKSSIFETLGIGKLGDEKTDEEIEARRVLRETELAKLVKISLTLPDTVLWNEKPRICYWCCKRECWVDIEMKEVVFDLADMSLSFRTETLKRFGFTIERYAHLPFVSWELRPEGENGVLLALSTKQVDLELLVTTAGVSLTKLLNGKTRALLDKLNTPYTAYELVRLFRDAGLDIFPAPDASLYVENHCEKYPIFERHTYWCMAITSSAFEYKQSKWNSTVGYREILLQMKTCAQPDQERSEDDTSTVYVTSYQAKLIGTTESSVTLDVNDAKSEQFYSDLFTLVEQRSSYHTRRTYSACDPHLTKNVFDLLWLTRVLSYAYVYVAPPELETETEANANLGVAIAETVDSKKTKKKKSINAQKKRNTKRKKSMKENVESDKAKTETSDVE